MNLRYVAWGYPGASEVSKALVIFVEAAEWLRLTGDSRAQARYDEARVGLSEVLERVKPPRGEQ